MVTYCGPISAETLTHVFAEGIAAIRSALQELRLRGLIETRVLRDARGRFTKVTSITELGYSYVRDFLLRIDVSGDHGIAILWSSKEIDVQRISRLIPGKSQQINSSVFDNNGFSATHFKDLEVTFPPFDEDTYMKEHQSKLLAFQNTQRQRRTQRFLARQGRPREKWTATDVSFEFADRIEKFWHIAPWRVTESRFTPALAAKRLAHDTNGEIECLMMDRFFETEKISEISSGDFLAGRFIYRFGQLAKFIKITSRMTHEEELQLAIEERAKNRKLLGLVPKEGDDQILFAISNRKKPETSEEELAKVQEIRRKNLEFLRETRA
jgi:DNA-binding PadR family transcriptional regulator